MTINAIADFEQVAKQKNQVWEREEIDALFKKNQTIKLKDKGASITVEIVTL